MEPKGFRAGGQVVNKAQAALIRNPEIPDLLLDRQASVLLEEFGAGQASPGSGSAAALMGLLAGKLIQTVCSISRRKFRDREGVYEFISNQIGINESQLRMLFEEDALEFNEIVNLRRQRDIAENPNEKSRLSRLCNERLEKATDFVLDVSDLCLQNLQFAVQVFREGWGSVRGDAGAAISAAIAGATSGVFIANLNLKSLGGRRYAIPAKERCDTLLEQIQNMQTELFSCMAMINEEATAALRNDLQLTWDF